MQLESVAVGQSRKVLQNLLAESGSCMIKTLSEQRLLLHKPGKDGDLSTPATKWSWPLSLFQRHFLLVSFYEASPNETHPPLHRKLIKSITYKWAQWEKAIVDLLAGIDSSNTLHYELVPVKKMGRWQFNREELDKYLLLRAVEWQSWPQFLSIGIGPAFFLWFSPWALILIVCIMDAFWHLTCLSYVNERWVRNGIWINALKWVTCPGMAIWFWLHSNRFLAAISLIWPMLIPVLSMGARVPLLRWIPRPLGEIQVKLFADMLRRSDKRLPPDIAR